jgi:hypothetical protein
MNGSVVWPDGIWTSDRVRCNRTGKLLKTKAYEQSFERLKADKNPKRTSDQFVTAAVGCLRVIEEYEAAGKRPTTFNIAAEVYQVRRDQCGNRMVSDAQHFSTERALASLGRKGLVTGQQHFEPARRYWMAAANAAVCGR